MSTAGRQEGLLKFVLVGAAYGAFLLVALVVLVAVSAYVVSSQA